MKPPDIIRPTCRGSFAVQCTLPWVLSREPDASDPQAIHAGTQFVTLGQLAKAIGANPAKSGAVLDREVSEWLEQRGWECVKQSIHGVRVWGFQRPKRDADIAADDMSLLASLSSRALAAGADFITLDEARQALHGHAATPAGITDRCARQGMHALGWQLVYRAGDGYATWGFVAPRKRQDGAELIGGRWIRRCYLDELAGATGTSADRILASLPLRTGQRFDTRDPSPELPPSRVVPSLAALLSAGCAALAIARTILRRTRRYPADAGQQPPAARGRAAR